MWKIYRNIIRRYPKISLQEERRLIRKAKKGSKQAADELVLRHIGFVIFRINKRAFPAYASRFGGDILSQAIGSLVRHSLSTFGVRNFFLQYRAMHGHLYRSYQLSRLGPCSLRFENYIMRYVRHGMMARRVKLRGERMGAPL